METDMKNRPRNSDHGQRPSAHAQPQPAPAFRSPETGRGLASLLADHRNAVHHHGREAQARRQDAEEQLRQITGREQMIAEKQREIEEFRAQKEREIASLREEIARMDTAAKNATGEADRHTQAQSDAEYAVQDLEGLLNTYAPAALELAAPANGTPPGGTPTPGTQPAGTPANGTPAVTTGAYAVPVAGNGTGPQPVPAPPQGH